MKTVFFAALVWVAHLGISPHASPQDGRKDPPRDEYPGFLSELRSADLIVKVTLTDSKLAVDGIKDIATLSGKIDAVYQGKAEAEQAIVFEVDRAALTAKQKRFGDFGHLFYFYQPPFKKGATNIFLIKAGKPRRATVIVADSKLVAEYVKVARLPDADAAVGLVRLLCRLAYDKKTAGWYPYDYPHLVLQDLAVNFKHLKTTSPEFRALLAEQRKDALKALEQSGGFALPFAVWLTAHTEKEHRRAALAALVRRHEQNEKTIATLEEEARKLAKEPKQPGDGISIEPLSYHLGIRVVYLSAMDLLLNPAWVHDTPQTLYDVLPARRFFQTKLQAASVLKAVKAMAR